jgi:hypothetical protein
MDWYIFLTPLLLLPIIFLFRLVGCSYPDFQYRDGSGDDGDDSPPLINITFILNVVDLIPPILPNPILYIWPKFRVDDDDGSGPSIQCVSNPISLNQQEPPFTFISVPTQVPAGNHTCSCDLFMLRLDMDVTIDPNNPNLPQAQQTIDKVNDNPDEPSPDPSQWPNIGQHLTGPAIVDPPTGFVADTVITFDLSYKQTDDTQYVLGDFSLAPKPL